MKQVVKGFNCGTPPVGHCHIKSIEGNQRTLVGLFCPSCKQQTNWFEEKEKAVEGGSGRCRAKTEWNGAQISLRMAHKQGWKR